MAQIINQTNGTMLFEEINPEKLDLLTMIGDLKGMNSLTDDKVKEILDTLCVKSFNEFIEKFDPVIYSFYNANNQKVMYTLKKPESIPEELLTEIHLNLSNSFLKMLLTLVDTKRSQGLLNVDFKFENLTELISPKKVMEDIKQNRKELRYVYGQYADLDEDDPKRADLGDQLNVMMEEASVNYNNIMALLPLAIEDIKTRLLLTSGGGGDGAAAFSAGVLTLDEQGELKVIEAPKQEESTALVTLDEQRNNELSEVIGEDYEALNEGSSNDYVKALVTRTFVPMSTPVVADIDVTKEIENYNTYLTFYKDAQADFIKIVKPLIEKIVGVRLFFEQYPSKVRGMKPTLLITNCSNEMMSKTTMMPRLDAYLNTVNGKNDFRNTIWYAIFPSVALSATSGKKLTRERFKGNKQTVNTNVNTIESLAMIMGKLQEYKVQCFFSFESNEKNTFSAIATDGIGQFIDRCESLESKPYSEFAIPCLPNFTIIPKDKSGVMLDAKMTLDENNLAQLSDAKQDIMKLWIEGVYVGAAYVAAGIVATYQCPEYLKYIFKKNVDALLPGVHFNIEAGENKLQVYTTLAKEITGFTGPVKDEINNKSFGFVFSSENETFNGLPVTNIMVYKARNLLKDDDNGGVYEPIYKTQVTTYIERVLRNSTGDFQEDRVANFFSTNPRSQVSQWRDKSDKINAIIGSGDDVGYTVDAENGMFDLNMNFNGNIKNLSIDIKRSTSSVHI